MNKNEILEIFKKNNLSERYINLCNRFSNYDASKAPKKSEVLEILKEKSIDLKFLRQESSFYEDLKINKYKCRFMLGYEYGMISSFYMLWSNENTIFREELGEIVEELGEDFFNKVKFRYPISTSLEDLKEILDGLLAIYLEFKEGLLSKQV